MVCACGVVIAVGGGAGGEFSSSSFLARIRPSWLTGRKKIFLSTWFLLLVFIFLFLCCFLFLWCFFFFFFFFWLFLFFAVAFFWGEGGGGAFAQKWRGIFH